MSLSGSSSPRTPVLSLSGSSSPRLSSISPTGFLASQGLQPASQYATSSEAQYRQALRDQLEHIGRTGTSFGSAIVQITGHLQVYSDILGAQEAERILNEEANQYMVVPTTHPGQMVNPSVRTPFESMEPTVRTPYHTRMINQPSQVGLTPAQYTQAAMPARTTQPQGINPLGGTVYQDSGSGLGYMVSAFNPIQQSVASSQPIQGRNRDGGLRFNYADALATIQTDAGASSKTPRIPM